jgi:6-phosphogluconolactonase (cycloisomerase 2 family)
MKLSRFGRVSLAFVVSVAIGLGMTACGQGTIGFMWVLGTQYNQIAGFKIDHNTGNLTAIPKSPFTSGGTNPVSIVVKSGGRFVYVVNQGTPAVGTTPAVAGNIAAFSVGNDGVLTFQQSYESQGSSPVWAVSDSAGAFLYVLDQIAPDGSGNGDITVFGIDQTTGRLQLIPNQQVKDAQGTQLTYFPVGPQPTMMRFSGAGCLYTINTGDQTVFPYSVGTAGQLTLTTNSTITTGAKQLTSISSNGNFVYLTDAGATTDSPGGFILPYTSGTGCSLNTVTGGAVANLPGTSNPVYSMTDSQGLFLYVVNKSSTNATSPATSSISAFSIVDTATGKLQPITAGGTENPYAVGAGPVCMVEDPSFQYIYTSNNIDGTVTGKQINKKTGQLSDLQRGSKFPATGQATCLTVSGNVS